MNEKKEKNEEISKYSNIEIVFGFFIFLILDLISIFFDVVSFGFLSTIIQFIAMGGMNIWAIFKKDKEALKFGKQILKYAAQALPFLPTLTIIFLFSAIYHNKKLDKI